MKLGDFVWYELATSDVNAAQRFYEHVTAAWSVARMDMPGMDYRIANVVFLQFLQDFPSSNNRLRGNGKNLEKVLKIGTSVLHIYMYLFQKKINVL